MLVLIANKKKAKRRTFKRDVHLESEKKKEKKRHMLTCMHVDPYKYLNIKTEEDN